VGIFIGLHFLATLILLLLFCGIPAFISTSIRFIFWTKGFPFHCYFYFACLLLFVGLGLKPLFFTGKLSGAGGGVYVVLGVIGQQRY